MLVSKNVKIIFYNLYSKTLKCPAKLKKLPKNKKFTKKKCLINFFILIQKYM